MDAKATWLLDVDGVINAPRAGWSQPPASGHVTVDGRTFKLRWSRDLVAALRRHHSSGAVSIRWASSWCGHTARLSELLRAPAFPDAIPAGLRTEEATAAKQAAAWQLLENGVPLIWTDDEALPEDVDAWLNHTTPALLVVPHPRRGLRADHLAAIDDFLAAPTSRLLKGDSS